MSFVQGIACIVSSSREAVVVHAVAIAVLLSLGGCGDGLGDCDPVAAQELVYGRTNGLVATTGQALAHDSCGNGTFCHSAAARGKERLGAPAGMDFDMLPTPKGLESMREHAGRSWSSVDSGDMPPGGPAGRVVANAEWSLDVLGSEEAPKLPAITTKKGREIFRNWLACGAPVVTDTQVPPWQRPPPDPIGENPTFKQIYDVVLVPQCATSGCHTPAANAGRLAFGDECAAHAALFRAGACGEPSIRARNADASLFIDKIASADPACGGPMPPLGRLPDATIDAIRNWINAGAVAEGCP